MTTTKKITELFASAWEQAINETARIWNEETGCFYTAKNDWKDLEQIAFNRQLEFDQNGFLVNKEES